MKNIKLIEVASEIGAGTRGASLGIDAIKIAALDFMSNFFIHFPSEKVTVENKLLGEANLKVTADSETWLGFLAGERNLVWSLLTRRVRLRGRWPRCGTYVEFARTGVRFQSKSA